MTSVSLTAGSGSPYFALRRPPWSLLAAATSRLDPVRPAARAPERKEMTHDVTERQAHGSQPVQVRSGETPRSPVVKPPASVERPASKRGGGNWPVRSMKRSLQRRHFARESGTRGSRAAVGYGEGHGRHLGSWSGCRGTLRRRGRGTVRRLSWELERPSSAPSLRGRERACL